MVTPIEDYWIGPLELGGTAQRWRVNLILENVLGMQSRPSQNLIEDSDDFTDTGVWPNGGGTVGRTGSQSDPEGGTDAVLLEDDASGAAEYIYHGATITDLAIQFDTASTKRFGCWIKAGSASSSEIWVYDNAWSAAPYLALSIAWSGGVPTVTATGYNGATGEVIRVRDDGSSWYWLEWTMTGLTEDSAIDIRVYPAGSTAADTGTLYLFRLCAIDRNVDIEPVSTSGGASVDVDIATDVTSLDNGDSPYDVLTSDNVMLVDISSGDLTINLPKALEFPRRELVIKVIGGSAPYNLTVTAASGDTSELTSINGSNLESHVLSADAGNNYWRKLASTNVGG
jgi:hypothetical protein